MAPFRFYNLNNKKQCYHEKMLVVVPFCRNNRPAFRLRNMGQSIWKKGKKVAGNASSKFNEANPIVYSAAIAFFTLFSMPSILLIIVRIAGAVIGPDEIKGEVYNQVRDKVGEESARQIQTVLERGRELDENLLGNILTIAVLVFTATVVFNFIKQALNVIWGVKPKAKKGITKFVIDRLISLLLIIVLGALLVASLLTDAFINFLGNELSDRIFGMASYLVWILNLVSSYLLVTLSFAMLFKFMPDIKISWKPVWIGALITGALFTLGKYIIGIIISQTNISSTYGAAGSLAAILLWVFYSSVIVLVGALITKIIFLYSGHTIKPRANAVAIETREVEKEELKE